MYRKRGKRTRHWLSMNAGKRLNDYLTRAEPPMLHAHSKDAAQEGFYTACRTARANRHLGARYPHQRKRYRTTVWKATGIRVKDTTILLARAKSQPPLRIQRPAWFTPATMRLLEVRLVWDRCARRYTWHLVVENGMQAKPAPGTTIVAVDLGEIHPAAATDGQTAVVVCCRALRAARQYTAKRLAALQTRQSRCHNKSRRWWKLQRCKHRFRAKQQRRIRDMEHKISRTVVEYAVDSRAGTLAIGDVRDIADGGEKGRHQNQKLSTWRHGKLRTYLTYKSEAEGMRVVLVNERYTSQTCPECGRRHKPKGRTYRCPDCRFQAHRDVVGAANILSRQLQGAVGKVRPPLNPMYRHPFLTGKRSRLDTGQPGMAVACHKQEAAGL